MARLIYTGITSLDGFAADAEGNFDWSAPDAEVHAHVNDGEREIGTYLYGRKIYEVMKVWETMPLDDEPEEMRDYASIWRGADKIVYSSSLDAVDTPRTRLERSFDVDAVRTLIASSSQDVGIAGPTLAAHAIRALPLAHQPRLVMVTAHGRDDVIRQAQAEGIGDVLAKPVNASTLFDAVIRLQNTGEAGAETSVAASSGETGAVIAALAALRGARILLVEDNEINQEVTLGLLDGFGFTVDVAANGQIAVDMVQQAGYDIVLMDMQMPVLGGVEATRIMRAMPQLADMPIVAMTANAMAQDMASCRAAGMVDIVTKPVEPRDLWRALLKWVVLPAAPEPQATAGVAAATGPQPLPPLAPVAGLDMALGLRQMLGKEPLYRAMLAKFAQDQADATARITAALGGDRDLAERLAHTLRGLAGTIGALALHQQAGLLETAIREQRAPSEIAAVLDATEALLRPLVMALCAQLPLLVPASAAPQSVDLVRFASLHTELATLIADNDPGALDLWRAEAGLLRAALPGRFEAIGRALDNYEFDEALRLLQAEI